MDEYSFISENGNVRQIRDLIAKEKDEQQDQRLDALEERKQGYDAQSNTYPRAFVKQNAPTSLIVLHDGLLVVEAHKKVAGYTVRLKVNGVVKDSTGYFGEDSSGTPLNFPIFTTTLRSWVTKNDVVTIDSDNSASGYPTTDDWYIAVAKLYYKVS